jgi:hypothetical protein
LATMGSGHERQLVLPEGTSEKPRRATNFSPIPRRRPCLTERLGVAEVVPVRRGPKAG